MWPETIAPSGRLGNGVLRAVLAHRALCPDAGGVGWRGARARSSHLAKSAIFLAFSSGIPYATGLRHLVPRRDAMEKKGSSKGKSQRAMKDLAPRNTQDVKGGGIIANFRV